MGSSESSRDPGPSVRLMLFCAGFAPIGALCLAAFGALPLSVGATVLVAPAIITVLAVATRAPRAAARGLALGILAVFVYDVVCRLPFVAMGVWHDFIPRIGDHLLRRKDVHWSVGYLWRYLGNGGGMGLAFYSVYPLIGKKIPSPFLGVAYGVSIYVCLLATLFLSPHGQEYLFVPTPETAYLGFLGHVIYGWVLGYGAWRWDRTAATIPSKIMSSERSHQHSYG